MEPVQNLTNKLRMGGEDELMCRHAALLELFRGREIIKHLPRGDALVSQGTVSFETVERRSSSYNSTSV